MGTRGFVGFVADGTEKIAYNHWDSYPSGLGVDVLSWLRSAGQDIESLREQIRALRVADPASEPTAEEIERLRQYADLNVGSRELTDWYVLLRKTQGNPAAMLEAGVIEDGSRYGGTEWGYVIDFDAGAFVVHEGERASKPVASWPLSSLPDDKAFLKAVDPSEVDDDD